MVRRRTAPRNPETLTPTEKRAVTMKKIEARQRMLAQIDTSVRERQASFDGTPRLRKL